MSEKRRVAVTGIGVVSPVGIGREAFWDGLLAPQPLGERRVHDFDPLDFYADPKQIRRADRFEQFAIACAQQALEESGPLDADPQRIGVLVGTGIGGAQTHEDQLRQAQLESIVTLRGLTQEDLGTSIAPVRLWAPFMVQQTGM